MSDRSRFWSSDSPRGHNYSQLTQSLTTCCLRRARWIPHQPLCSIPTNKTFSKLSPASKINSKVMLKINKEQVSPPPKRPYQIPPQILRNRAAKNRFKESGNGIRRGR